MPAPHLYGITDRHASDRDLVELVAEACAAGLLWVQVREKDLAPPELARLVRRVCEICQPHGGRVLVNGHADLAHACGADGVQLTESSATVAEVRAAFPGLTIGASAHSIERAARCAAEGADFVVYGPVFDTPSKRRYGSPQGLDRLAAVCVAVDVPVVAIGGIDPITVGEVRAAGAHGVAAIRALFAVADVAAAVRAFRSAIDGAPPALTRP